MLKNDWQVEQGELPSSEKSCTEGNLFKIDLRVQGHPQTAVLEDPGRMTKIRHLVKTLRTQSRTESVIADLKKTGEFNRFSEESKEIFQKLGKIELFELEEVAKKLQCSSFTKYWPEGLGLL